MQCTMCKIIILTLSMFGSFFFYNDSINTYCWIFTIIVVVFDQSRRQGVLSNGAERKCAPLLWTWAKHFSILHIFFFSPFFLALVCLKRSLIPFICATHPLPYNISYIPLISEHTKNVHSVTRIIHFLSISRAVLSFFSERARSLDSMKLLLRMKVE